MTAYADADRYDENGEPFDPHAVTRRVFPRLDWHELWADDAEDEWLHEPLLPARRSVVIYSPAKAGKSLLVLDLAVHLTRGTAFLGSRYSRRVRVLYVDFENDPRGDVRSRLQAMGYGPDDLDHLDYLSFPTMAGLDTARGGSELLAAVEAYESEVVIVDTVCRAVAGEENSNDTWLGLYRNTGLILKRAGVSVVRLDHSGKDETRGQRGGSAKSGDVDAVWRLTRVTDDRLRLDCTDSRMQIPVKSLHIQRHASPRLRHVLETTGGLSFHDQKVADLVRLCDDNGIPWDANRETVRAFIRGRGFGAKTDVITAIVRARKTDPRGRGQLGSGSAGDSREPSGSVGVSTLTSTGLEHETYPETDPHPSGSAGGQGSQCLTPSPQPFRVRTGGHPRETGGPS